PLFFFSSRRRHTRWPRDWSSDVCSSDLRRLGRIDETMTSDRVSSPSPAPSRTLARLAPLLWDSRWKRPISQNETGEGWQRFYGRSEERRVGKECESVRWEEPANAKIICA